MWKWLETPATPRRGESQADAEKRMTWVNRIVKGWFAWEVVIPAALLVAVLVVLIFRSFF